MESIDRLRKYVANHTDRTVALTTYPEQYGVRCTTTINNLIDAIEREVKEKYVELPIDADGIPVHVNDEMESVYSPDKVFIVKRLKYSERHGWMIGGATKEDLGEYRLYNCRFCYHHKSPTVENVLMEFTDAILEWTKESGTVAEVGTWSDVAAEYAKRLQLREEEE